MSWDAVSWARPEWLWALVVVPVAAVAIAWSLRRRRFALETFAESGVRARTQPLSRGRPALRGALLTIGLAALSLAAAGPQWGVEAVPDPPVRQHVLFALDVSRSMLAEDALPSRLDRAKLAVRQLLGGLPAAEAGLVVFAGEASLAVPLTRDHAALELYLGTVGPDWISDPSTDLSNAVAVSLDAFGPGPGRGEAIVLLTDGEDQTGGVEAAVSSARERGVQVDAIGVGTESGARIPIDGEFLIDQGAEVVTRLEPEPLRALASATGGAYVELAAGPGDVGPVLARLRALDAGAARGTPGERKADRYRWPLALAVLCIAGEAWLRLRDRRRSPRLDPALAAGAALLVLAIASAAGIGVVLWPPVARRLLRAGDAEAATAPGPGTMALAIAANTTAWVGYGVALWCLARGVLAAVALPLGAAVGAFTASYLAGLLALFAPGGLVVREALFIVLLQPVLGLPRATALALASRLLLTVTEVGVALPFLASRRSPRAESRDS